MSESPRHYLHVFSTFAAGGPQMRAVTLMDMMGGECRHTVIAMDGCEDCAAALPAGVEVALHPAPIGGVRERLRGMRRCLRELSPDLLLTYNWGAIEWLWAARRAGHRALVHHEDGFGPEEAERFFRRRIYARRFLLRGVRAVLVPSRTLHDVALRHWHVARERLFYLPNGVDLERFRPGDRGDRDAVVVGCVGGVRPEKNQALAVAAFARLSRSVPTRLLIIGDGPDLPAVRRLAEERGVADRVEFAGAVSDTAPYYAKMDVFLIPSRTEQMPLALLEAMASGLPVVGTDVGDVAHMLAEPNRPSVVPKGDVSALVGALDALLGDRGLRRRLGVANRRRCEEEFDAGRCYGAWVGHYLRASEPAGS